VVRTRTEGLKMSTNDRRPKLSPSEVTEQHLPGIGHRFDLEAADGEAITVVIHHSGRRDLYVGGSRRDAVPTAVTLNDAQARTLGAILSGAYFKPAVVDEIEAVVGELLIDWVTLREDSPGTGRSIAELEIRQQTGMTIAAILRDHEAMVAPEPRVVLQADDRLVVLGRPSDFASFVRRVVG
jgi:TrkA domain protein